MNNRINSISNEFEKAVRTAEEKLLAGKISGFNMYCSYAEGIFFGMLLYEKVEKLPMRSINKLKRLGYLAKCYDFLKNYIAGIKKEERVEILAGIFKRLMKEITFGDNIASLFGMAKGILLVMQELGASQNLDKHFVEVHRGMTKNIMKMIDVNDSMHGF